MGNNVTLPGVGTPVETIDQGGGVERQVVTIGSIGHAGSETQLGTTMPVSGAVTANAGTNLNTSALALETGGNLATLAGIVSGAKAAVKSADGDLSTVGVTTGTAVITDAPGTLQQYLRGIVKLLAAGITVVLGAGSAIIGTVKVGAGTNIYNTVAASQTSQALTGGSGGALGDYLEGLLIVPATTSPGAVTVTDAGGPTFTIFAGGASSVPSLIPFPAIIDAVSAHGAWEITTGSNVSVVATGKFT